MAGGLHIGSAIFDSPCRDSYNRRTNCSAIRNYRNVLFDFDEIGWHNYKITVENELVSVSVDDILTASGAVPAKVQASGAVVFFTGDSTRRKLTRLILRLVRCRHCL